MPIIYTYPSATPATDDYLVISDVSETDPINATRKCTVGDIVSLVGALVPGGGTVTSIATTNSLGASSGITFAASPNPITTTGTITTSFAGTIGDMLYADTATSLAKLTAGTSTHVLTSNGPGAAPSWQATPTAPVTSVSGIAAGTSNGTAVVVTPTTGLVTIQPMAFAGDTNVGHVPDASVAAVGSYLKNDGTWTVPPDTNTTYSMMTDTVLGLGKLEDNTTQTVAANTVTTTVNRTYGIQKNSSNQLVVNVPWTDSGAVNDNGWDILNFAQGQAFTGSLAIGHLYQVVVPENFTANKAKIYVDVAGGASTFVVGIYDGVLSNLAGATKLGDGTVTPSADGIVEVTLTKVSPGDLDLTKGQNIIMAFTQSAGDKLLCINGRVADANLAITATLSTLPSTLNSLSDTAADALRPCCVLYQN